MLSIRYFILSIRYFMLSYKVFYPVNKVLFYVYKVCFASFAMWAVPRNVNLYFGKEIILLHEVPCSS